MKKGRILVVIPYLAAGAQGRELEFAVAGWRRHFKEDYLIVLVGDRHPVVDTGDDITFISCPQVPDTGYQNYRPHIDHVRKFRKVLESFPDAKGFIYACDDMYAVNDFDMTDIRFLKIISDDIKGNPKSTNGWQRDAAKTRALLKSEGLPVLNFVCHLPVWYEVDKLLAIYDRYDCDHNSYIVEDIYYNTYYRDRVPFKLDRERDNLKLGVYASPDFFELTGALDRKIWITNSPIGYGTVLEAVLDDYFFGSGRNVLRNVAIVHYNTPELTRATILSIRKHTPGCNVYVFDNSDRRPFVPMDGVTVLDNTRGQLVDFDAILSRYPGMIETGNNYGSVKHSLSVDYLFDVLTDGFVLMDSDVLLKRDISSLFDPRCIWSGEVFPGSRKKPVPTLIPFLCWINVPFCKKYGIRYFDGNRSWGLHPGELFHQYDTGASFLEDCAATREPVKRTSLGEYIVHLRAGSWMKKDWMSWLDEHRDLYE